MDNTKEKKAARARQQAFGGSYRDALMHVRAQHAKDAGGEQASADDEVEPDDIVDEELAKNEEEAAREAMREWFFLNYEDPANGVPWEGEYIYVGGGPYDPWEELAEQFEGKYPLALIEKVATSIAQSGGTEWVQVGQY